MSLVGIYGQSCGNQPLRRYDKKNKDTANAEGFNPILALFQIRSI